MTCRFCHNKKTEKTFIDIWFLSKQMNTQIKDLFPIFPTTRHDHGTEFWPTVLSVTCEFQGKTRMRTWWPEHDQPSWALRHTLCAKGRGGARSKEPGSLMGPIYCHLIMHTFYLQYFFFTWEEFFFSSSYSPFST